MATGVPFLILGALVACGQDKIGVAPARDNNHGALQIAVDRFVTSGRTPGALTELWRTVRSLQPGMDRDVANEAELRLVVLALDPTSRAHDKPIAARVDLLALTVWPILLDVVPEAGESQQQFVERLCATRCKDVVAEDQGAVLEAVAIKRGNERIHNAMSACLACSDDWHREVLAWETLDHAVATELAPLQRRASPSNWPTAGSAAAADQALPEAELSSDGDLVIGGLIVDPKDHLAALRELRGAGDAIALHARPDTPLARIHAVLIDAGTARVAIVAREPVYPWHRKLYWVAAHDKWRPSDSLQGFLRAIDALP